VYNTDYCSMARIVAVRKSEQKGTRKKVLAEGVLKEDCGPVGDAHADCWTHRQASLLATGSIDKVKTMGFEVGEKDECVHACKQDNER
jgi:hypothetical protein